MIQMFAKRPCHALGVLVGREDFPMNQAVLTTLLARAGDSDEDVRQAARDALGVLVGREDFPMNQAVLTTLLARAGDSDIQMFAKRPFPPWACWWAGKISR
jgi:hypothetical protein